MAMSHSRYFVNPYPYEPEAGFDINKLNRETIKSQLMSKAQEVFRNTSDTNADAGLYLGPAGNSYMYIHILSILTPDERKKMLSFAMQSYELHAKFYEKSSRVNTAGFLEGKLGIDAIGAVLGKFIGNEKMQNDCLTSFKSQASILSDVGFLKENGGDEFFNGRSGFLYGALWLQQHFGFQPVSRESLKSVWKAIVNSGKEYSLHTKSIFPLMFYYYGTQYLGAAHGLTSILQVLISFPDFLTEEPDDAQLINTSIELYLQLQDNNGNFPCAMDEIGPSERSEEDKLVHFCHGAPGAIYLFAKAYLVYKEEKYLNSALKCGELVWQRGLLRKGPGICHGIAGNGYVFLLLWNLLDRKDDRHLYRAYKYAEFLNHPDFKREARRPDCPYSLYEGEAGTVCFLSDVVKPENAEFPFFNVYNNCKFA